MSASEQIVAGLLIGLGLGLGFGLVSTVATSTFGVLVSIAATLVFVAIYLYGADLALDLYVTRRAYDLGRPGALAEVEE